MKDVKIKLTGDASNAIAAVGRLRASLDQTNTTASKLSQIAAAAAAQMVDGAKDATRAYDQLAESARRAADAQRSGAGRSGGLGGAVSSLTGGGVGNAARALGAGNIDGLLDAIDALRDLSAVGADFAQTITSSGGALGSLTGSAASAIGGVTGLGAGLSSLIAVAAPAAIVLGGVAVALEQASSAADAIQQVTAAYIAQRDTLRDVRDEALTTDEVRDRIAAAERQRADAQADIDKARSVREATFANLAEQYGDAQARLTFGLVEGRGAFAALDEDVKRATAELEAAETAIKAYEAAIASGATAAGDAAAAQAELTRQLKELDTAESGLIAQRERGLQAVEALTRQEQELTAAFARQQAQQAQDLARQTGREGEQSGIRARRAVEDLTAALADQLAQQQQSLIDIAQAGAAAIQRIEADTAARRVAAAEAVASVEVGLAADLAAARAAYNRDELRQLQDFQRNQRRLREDGQRAENDAIRSGNVIAFLDARANRLREQQRGREDFTVAQQRRAQDFEQQQQQQRAAAAERIAGIRAELQAFTAAQQQKIQAERAAIDQRTSDQIAAFDQQQQRERTARELTAQREAEDRALRARYADEDRAIEQARAREALAERLGAIQRDKDAQLAQLGEIATKVANVRQTELRLLDAQQRAFDTAFAAIAARAALVNNLLGTGGTPNTVALPGQSSTIPASGTPAALAAAAGSSLLGLPSAQPLAFAGLFDKGGMVKAGRPQFGLFGGKENEYVFTESQMRGMGGGGRGVNMPLTFNLKIEAVQVGKVVSPDEARKIAHEIGLMAVSDAVDYIAQGFAYVQRGQDLGLYSKLTGKPIR